MHRCFRKLCLNKLTTASMTVRSLSDMQLVHSNVWHKNNTIGVGTYFRDTEAFRKRCYRMFMKAVNFQPLQELMNMYVFCGMWFFPGLHLVSWKFGSRRVQNTSPPPITMTSPCCLETTSSHTGCASRDFHYWLFGGAPWGRLASQTPSS